MKTTFFLLPLVMARRLRRIVRRRYVVPTVLPESPRRLSDAERSEEVRLLLARHEACENIFPFIHRRYCPADRTAILQVFAEAVSVPPWHRCQRCEVDTRKTGIGGTSYLRRPFCPGCAEILELRRPMHGVRS
jgi:hypothetical protein